VIIRGDARRLPLPNEIVDAVVTDPPYELGFMGKRWDRAGVAYDPATWAEAYRVLKRGGRLLAFGGNRTHHRIWCAIEDAGFVIEDTIMWLYGSGFPKHRSKLKPAYEPIVVARKGPVTPLNIDSCRIGTAKEGDPYRFVGTPKSRNVYAQDSWTKEHWRGQPINPNEGRWPANVVLDEEAAEALDAQAGTSGASRFFYVAKASRAERNAGLEGMPRRPGGSNAKGLTADVARGIDRNRPVENHHPTVKPVALMRWLVRLVTQSGDLVLDPFGGSGTTGVACTLEGRRCILVDNEPEYCEIAKHRIAATPLSLFAAVGVGD